MKYALSICLPVYNQIELVRWNLENLTQNPYDDVQIVISDDCSTEDIKSLVESFSDSRIKYCKTPGNIGHDANIINAFLNCDSSYAFLIRARDTITVDKISSILNVISNNPNAAYFRFGAKGLNDEIRMSFNDCSYPCGKSSIKADSFIPIHPSGELYNLSYISRTDLEWISSFVLERFPDKNGFVSHIMIRHLLASKGALVTVSDFVWFYAKTAKSNDVAVNSGKGKNKGISPYSPRFQYKRFRSEIEFTISKIPYNMQKNFVKYIIKRYAEYITVIFGVINNSEGMRSHYDCEKEDFSSVEEKKRFLEFSNSEFDFCDNKMRKYIKSVSRFYIKIYLPLLALKKKIKHESYQL